MAKLIGQSKLQGVGGIFRQGLWLGLLLGILNLALLLGIKTMLPSWGFDTALQIGIAEYLGAASWGILPAVVLLAARNVCEAAGKTKPVLLVQLAGLFINFLADLGFGLGWFGLPMLGLAGIGWSTTIVMFVTCLLLFVMVNRDGFRRYRLFTDFDPPDLKVIKRLLVLSSPICLSLLFESGLFTATALQIGKLGVLPASAHNIAIGATAVFYMIPLGLSFALTARMGVSFGRAHDASIRLRAGSGILITIAMATCSSIAIYLFRDPIAALYTQDVAVQRVAAQLLILAAIFQLSDALQVTLLALLRGIQDTRIPMLINAFSYWVVGFGTGYYCAHTLGLGPHGFWMGLIAGLTTSAILLSWRLYSLCINPEKLFSKQA